MAIVFVSCGGIGFGPSEYDIGRMYDEANDILSSIFDGRLEASEKNWNQAIKQFSDIAKSYPKSKYADDAQFNIGFCYIWSYGVLKDSPKKAIEAFENFIKRYPKSDLIDNAYYWKAYAYAIKGDYKRAIMEYQIFGNRYPDSELYKDSLYQIDECRSKLQPKITTPSSNIVPDSAKDIKKQEPVKKEEIIEAKKPSVSVQSAPPVRESAKTLPDNIPKSPKIVKSTEFIYVEDIRFHSGQNYTRVVLDLSEPVKYDVKKLTNPDRIYVDVREAAIESSRTEKIEDGIIRTIRASQFDLDTVRVVLDVNKAGNYRAFSLKNPDRIVLDIHSDAKPDSPPVDSPVKRPSVNNKSPKKQEYKIPEVGSDDLVKQLGLKVKTIVIDPGHGGKDPGAIGASGTHEKKAVLDIAKRLKALLESKKSYQVYLTRETDVYIPLEERTNIANQKGADVFISIHINASKATASKGIETYYLSLASDENARLTAALENASSDRSIKDLGSLVLRLLRSTKVKESSDLAQITQSRLCKVAGSNNRGIKRAPFIVLIGAEAPSILVELGFISNSEDERLLKSDEYKDKIASALMDAIEDYIRGINQAS